MAEPYNQDDLLEFRTGQDNLVIQTGGAWTRVNAGYLDRQLNDFIATFTSGEHRDSKQATLDLSALKALDTFGAWLIYSTRDRLEKLGITTRIENVHDDHSLLLEEIFRASAIKSTPEKEKGAFLRFVDEVLVRGIAGIGSDIQALLGFLGLVTTSLLGMLVRPGRFSVTSFVYHLEYIGFRAVPIVSLICFMIGAVIMQQGIVQLSKYGIGTTAVGSAAVLALREVAVLLTAILVAGRSSSAFTAEIGSMKMREEIDAMKTLGINPIDTLVIPRIMALVVILPALVFIADFMCLLGGAVMSWVYLGMSMEAYIDELHKWLTLNHFFAGMIKTPFIAVAIGIVGCVEGLKVEGSAESLGKHVTSAVVKSIFLVIILDALFAILLAAIAF